MKILSKFPASPEQIRMVLFFLLSAVLLPMMVLEGVIFYTWHGNQWKEEMAANRKFAEAVARSFELLIHDINRQEWGIGKGLVLLQNGKKEQIDRFLGENARGFSPAIRFLAWVSPEGRVLSASRREVVGRNVRNHEHFRRVLSGAAWAASDLLPAGFFREPGLFLFRRIEDENGILQGVMMVEIDPEKLGILVSRIKGLDEGLFTIFDHQGRVVYDHPELNLKWEQREWKKTDPLLVQALTGKEAEGVWVSPADQERNIAVRLPIRSIGWVAGASCPEKKAMKAVYWNMEWVLAGSLGVIGFSVAMTWLVARRVILPIHFLQNYAKELDIRVQDRTSELERSNAELEQFTYVASHDLQEPLRMVVSYVQLLKKEYQEKLGPEADEFINFAVEGATRMQRLINDLLALLRVKTRFSPFKPVDCEKILGRVLGHMKTLLNEAQAEITHDPLPVVTGDETQLTLVFRNLIDNAVKFHGPCSPRIHLAAEAGEQGWIFSVRDNGIGIEPEYFGRIFVIFQRLHTRRHYEGTGIGLALCKRIVERHGGRIWVVSKPNEGSTFFFTIPSVR